MTTYHVWLKGQDQPEVVQADTMQEVAGLLTFYGRTIGRPDGPTPFQFTYTVLRQVEPEQWDKWSIVHDEADHII